MQTLHDSQPILVLSPGESISYTLHSSNAESFLEVVIFGKVITLNMIASETIVGVDIRDKI